MATPLWQYCGQIRPDFAETPGPGQESVWDYPRPPVLQPDSREILIGSAEVPVAKTRAAVRIIETASPPTFYIPCQDVNFDQLVEAPGGSYCEWKGDARYWCLKSDPSQTTIAWSYAEPTHRFQSIKDSLGFYPGRIPCFVEGERVRPQPGYFYGGWMTNEIVGPVKGEPGTGGW